MAELLPPRYTYKGTIGSGGMGIVYHALDTQLQRDVAVKSLPIDSSLDTNSRERFFKEAQTLALLDHPNIVKLLSTLVHEDRLLLVMEFIQGKPFSDEIANGKKLDLQRFHIIFGQILSGLSYAHEKGIVHRDLKPSNILISDDANGINAKIIDFGIARIDSDTIAANSGLTQTGALLGSPTYMSPEQCKGSKVDRLSDIYSLACIMYEALAGHPPQLGETAVEIIYKKVNDDWQRLGSLKYKNDQFQQLAKLVDTCLSKNPNERPAAAAQVKEELDRLLKGQQPGIFESIARKNHSSLILATSAFIIFGVVFAYFFISKSGFSSMSGASSKQVDARAQRRQQDKDKLLQEKQKTFARYEKIFQRHPNASTAQDMILIGKYIFEHLKYHKHFDEAISLAKQLIEVSNAMEDKDLPQADLHQRLGGLYAWELKDLAAGKREFDLALLHYKNSKCEDDMIAGLYHERCNLEMQQNDLKDAIIEFRHAADVWKNNQRIPYIEGSVQRTIMHKTEGHDPAPEHCIDLLAKIDNSKLDSDEDKVDALELANIAFEVLLYKGCLDINAMSSQLSGMAESIPENTKGYARVAAQTYELLANFAEAKGHPEDANYYRRKANLLSKNVRKLLSMI